MVRKQLTELEALCTVSLGSLNTFFVKLYLSLWSYCISAKRPLVGVFPTQASLWLFRSRDGYFVAFRRSPYGMRWETQCPMSRYCELDFLDSNSSLLRQSCDTCQVNIWAKCRVFEC